MPGRRRRTSATRRSATATSRTATRTTPAKRTAAAPEARAPRSAAAPEVPVAGPGERVWVLAVPFRAPAPGAGWHAGLQATVYVGAALPPELAGYRSAPHTFERFLEDDLNAEPRPVPAGRPMTPRAEQRTGAAAVAAHAAAGGRMFLLGDDPGDRKSVV